MTNRRDSGIRDVVVLAMTVAWPLLQSTLPAQIAVAGPYDTCAFGIGDVNKDRTADYYGHVSSRTRFRGTAYSGATQRRLYTSTCVCPAPRDTIIDTKWDLNADGYPDWLVGAPYGGPFQIHGAILFFSGKDGALLHTRFGKNKGDEFGFAVCFLGDINNNKRAVFAVSIPRSGNSGSPTTEIHSLSGRLGYAGTNVRDPINHLRLLGDVNGDGKTDFLATSTKKSYLYSVSTTSFLRSYAVTIADKDPVDAGLDVNKDGAADFVYGSPWASSNKGAAYVYSAKDGKLLHTFTGSAAKQRFGSGVALIDDLNGDGHADILVGAEKGVVPRTGSARGSVQAFSGRTGELLFTIAESTYAKRVLGTGINVIGDLNGDKVPEVAIPRADGVYIYDLQLGGGYGQGCASTARLPTLRADLPPRVGGSVRFTVADFLKSTTGNSGGLIIGASDKVWGTVPLPLDLSVMGATRCSLLCSFDILVPFTTTTGSKTFQYTIPKDYSLLGIHLFEQAFAQDAAANPTGLATTNGLRIRVMQ